MVSLIEQNFIQRRGILLFFSDGEDSREGIKGEPENFSIPINALRNIGFTTFSFLINTGRKKYMSQNRMKSIAGNSENRFFTVGQYDEVNLSDFKNKIQEVSYNSPILFTEHETTKKMYKNEIKKKESHLSIVKMECSKKDKIIDDLNSNQKILESNLRKKQSALDDKTLELQKKKKVINKLRNAKNFFLILIPIISLLAVSATWLLGKKRSGGKERNEKQVTPQSQQKLSFDCLWGKIKFTDPATNSEREDDLSKKESPYKPSYLQGVEFVSEIRDEKKVIAVRQEKGTQKFLKSDTELCENNCGYISTDTQQIEIKCGKEPVTLKYNFCENLAERVNKPVLEKDISAINKSEIFKIKSLFRGRETVLNRIEKNFNKEFGVQHCIISGMSNSGKTSLMRYLSNVLFDNESVLGKKFVSHLFEFRPDIIDSFSDFKREIVKTLTSKAEIGNRKKLILLDEYDKAFDKFPEEFGAYIKEVLDENNDANTPDCFFIFAGQRGPKLLNTDCRKYISKHTNNYILSAFDDDLKSDQIDIKSNSVRFLDLLLADVGIPPKYFADDIKKRIVKFASGFPYFILKILHQVLKDWLNENEINFTETLIDQAVRKVADNIGNDYDQDEIDPVKRAIKFDHEFNKDSGKTDAVEIVHMIEMLRKDVLVNDRINENDFRQEMAMYSTTNKTLISARKKSFDKKVDQLIQMGLFIRDKKDLIPVPNMFFY